MTFFVCLLRMSYSVDKNWVHLHRGSDEYKADLKDFLDFCFSNLAVKDKVKCPCRECYNRLWKARDVIKEHMEVVGIDAKYKRLPWTKHGESIVNDTVPGDVDMSNDFHNDHNMHGLLNDLFRANSDQENSGSSSQPVPNTGPNPEASGSSSQPAPNTGPNPEAAKFYQLIKDANVPLYPGCDNFSKLEFIVQLIQIKCLYGWSDKSVSVLLTL